MYLHRNLNAKLSGAMFVGTVLLVACGPQTDTDVWVRADWSGTPNLPVEAAAGTKVIYVKFDLEELQSPKAERIEFPLPDGKPLILDRGSSQQTIGGGFIWQGKVEGDDHSLVTLSILNGTLVGDVVRSNAKMYRLDQVGDGIQIIFKLNPGAFPRESQPISLSAPDDATPVSAAAVLCEDDKIEALVVYTNAACAAAFVGEDVNTCTPLAETAIQNKIQLAEGETNQIFSNSLTDPRISILKKALIDDYSEADSVGQDLDRLKVRNLSAAQLEAGQIAELQQVHDLRELFGADVVTLVTRPQNDYPSDQSCGKSTLMGVEADWFEKHAFSVVPVDCVDANFSFAHELGHLMGADHDSAGGRQQTSFTNNRGFVNSQPANGEPWRTVMAENGDACTEARPVVGCARLPYFSSSDASMKHGGEAMGSDEANNRAVVASTADTVMQFRTSLSCNTQ